jgi:hypothetical protein
MLELICFTCHAIGGAGRRTTPCELHGFENRATSSAGGRPCVGRVGVLIGQRSPEAHTNDDQGRHDALEVSLSNILTLAR